MRKHVYAPSILNNSCCWLYDCLYAYIYIYMHIRLLVQCISMCVCSVCTSCWELFQFISVCVELLSNAFCQLTLPYRCIGFHSSVYSILFLSFGSSYYIKPNETISNDRCACRIFFYLNRVTDFNSLHIEIETQIFMSDFEKKHIFFLSFSINWTKCFYLLV